jgi:hypothetical protein
VIAFVFWKLDQRTKFFIKNAENALRYFEGLDQADEATKVFTNEEEHRTLRIARGWRRVLHLSYNLSYSECFNSVFLTFFLLGVGSLLFHFRIWATLRRMLH